MSLWVPCQPTCRPALPRCGVPRRSILPSVVSSALVSAMGLNHAVVPVRRTSTVCTWSANRSALGLHIGPMINDTSRRRRSPLRSIGRIHFASVNWMCAQTLLFAMDAVAIEVFVNRFDRQACVHHAHLLHVAPIILHGLRSSAIAYAAARFQVNRRHTYFEPLIPMQR